MKNVCDFFLSNPPHANPHLLELLKENKTSVGQQQAVPLCCVDPLRCQRYQLFKTKQSGAPSFYFMFCNPAIV